MATVELAKGVTQKSESTFYITCTVSGKLCFCNKGHMDSLLKKHGSYEKIGATYISRDAKRLMKENMSPEVIKKIGVEDMSAQAEMIHEDKQKAKVERKEQKELNPPTPIKAFRSYLSKSAKDVFDLFEGNKACLRPQLFTSNGGYCDGCGWLSYCEYSGKMEITDGAKERVGEIEKLANKVDVLTDDESETAMKHRKS